MKRIKKFFGVMLCLAFVVLFIISKKFEGWQQTVLHILTICSIGAGISLLLPQTIFFKEKSNVVQNEKKTKGLSKRTLTSLVVMIVVIPLTVWLGTMLFGERKYYFISMLIIVEMMLPFGVGIESRKTKVLELVIISVLCAIAIIGRELFFMLPMFKPLLAIVIISGVCLGGEAGFLVGSICMFVSNIYFGQGVWTPWQMFAAGMIGMIAGVFYKTGILRKNKVSLSIYGGLATIFIYGGIMNPASVLMWTDKPTLEMFVMAYLQGFSIDLVHAASTSFFLWVISIPMIEKIDRIKNKYGININ